jgi:hypothetical protein
MIKQVNAWFLTFLDKFFTCVVFEVLPVSKTTAVCNHPVLIGFQPYTTHFLVFCSVGPLIQSGSMESCLAAQKRILYFKGPGSFKKSKTSAEMLSI